MRGRGAWYSAAPVGRSKQSQYYGYHPHGAGLCHPSCAFFLCISVLHRHCIFIICPFNMAGTHEEAVHNIWSAGHVRYSHETNKRCMGRLHHGLCCPGHGARAGCCSWLQGNLGISHHISTIQCRLVHEVVVASHIICFAFYSICCAQQRYSSGRQRKSCSCDALGAALLLLPLSGGDKWTTVAIKGSQIAILETFHAYFLPTISAGVHGRGAWHIGPSFHSCRQQTLHILCLEKAHQCVSRIKVLAYPCVWLLCIHSHILWCIRGARHVSQGCTPCVHCHGTHTSSFG
mmetsp:Transcript_10267/g.20264  ORF Transcript_10267/g.20264 Transcript_10267/m.20264 type:complete len:289 (-) Transcript_10267:322-1188(-)